MRESAVQPEICESPRREGVISGSPSRFKLNRAQSLAPQSGPRIAEAAGFSVAGSGYFDGFAEERYNPTVQEVYLPLYEYECTKCRRRVEKIQKFSDPPLTTCEFCEGPLKRLLSSAAIQFKGSGWYVTDYARKSAPTGGESSAESSPSTEKTESSASKEEKKEKKEKKEKTSSPPADPAKASPSKT
jgi:putative FmdB family regulatory protein